MEMPTQTELINPAFQAVKAQGGEATNEEIHDQVVDDLGLPDDIVKKDHPGKSSQTALEYRLAWARTLLKKAGYLENLGGARSGRWGLSSKGERVDSVDGSEVRSKAR